VIKMSEESYDIDLQMQRAEQERKERMEEKE
jgi:hypothetical protein